MTMIQWCEDCKYSFTTDNYRDEYCGECIDNSEAGEIPVRYEQAGDSDASAQPEPDTRLYSDGFCDGYKQGIKDAQSEQRWVPCVDGNEPKANAECWISTNAKYVKRASYAPKANNQPNGFIVTDGGFGFYEYGKSAKAWMPYTKEPEPYREEGGE